MLNIAKIDKRFSSPKFFERVVKNEVFLWQLAARRRREAVEPDHSARHPAGRPPLLKRFFRIKNRRGRALALSEPIFFLVFWVIWVIRGLTQMTQNDPNDPKRPPSPQ